MDLRVTFPTGGTAIHTEIEGWRVISDQSAKHGGDGNAPEPFQYFLASLAACAGAYVQGFCRNRAIDTSGIALTQHAHFDPQSRRLARLDLSISVPPDFPERYLPALERVAAKCTVKKVLESPPEFDIRATIRAPQKAA